MATIQYALKRAIEREFQLEEAELSAEPMPTREDRKGVLFYESSEGGAGVLGQVGRSIEILRRIGREALRTIHQEISETGALPEKEEDLTEIPGANCIAGCYHCLLSYYNQTEHAIIDRCQPLVRQFLLNLTRAEFSIQAEEKRQTLHGVPVVDYDQASRTVSVLPGVDFTELEDRGYKVTILEI